MMKHEDMVQLVQGVLKLYSIAFKVSTFPHYKVIISKSIFDERLKLCQSLFERQEVYGHRDELEQLNGTMVGPENDDRTYYLIVSEERFADQISYIGTVAHEFTHILDFAEYFEQNNIIDTRFIKNADYNFAHFYSEIRARYRGSLLSWKLQNMTQIDTVSFSRLIEQYGDILKHGMRLYYIAQFYGQYIAAKSLDPNFDIPLPKYLDRGIIPLLSLIAERINDSNIYDSYDEIKHVFDDLEGEYQ